MRASSPGAVVSAGRLSELQQRAYVRSASEERIAALLEAPQPPDLVVLSGSAGSGKSHLIQVLHERCGGQLGQTITDATHAESPDTEQADRLLGFFAPFADGSQRPGGPTRLIAMNTGMVLKFFSDAERRPGGHPLSALKEYLLERLGVPGAKSVGSRPDWLEDAVLVVNLDHRPTAGSPGSLLRPMLESLDPAKPDGLLRGAERCETCLVREWCYPRANLEIISSPTAVDVLDRTLGTVALKRGREIAPRDLWDFLAGLALGASARRNDPCDEAASLASKGGGDAAEQLLDGLVVARPLDHPDGDLAVRVARLDESFTPSSQAHDIIASAGISPPEDARRLRDWIGSDRPGTRLAVERLAQAVEQGRLELSGRYLARAAWLGGYLRDEDESSVDEFRRILAAVEREIVDDELLEMRDTLADGLARAFGLSVGPETFFPTDSAEGETAVLVKASLLDDTATEMCLGIRRDPAWRSNGIGSRAVSYRPLGLHVDLGGQAVQITYPLWTLLQQARNGAVASSVDLERFHGLRRALEEIGRLGSTDPSRPLLVSDLESGRAFRIARQSLLGKETLRASEVYPS
jgi:hypothetical protein